MELNTPVPGRSLGLVMNIPKPIAPGWPGSYNCDLTVGHHYSTSTVNPCLAKEGRRNNQAPNDNSDGATLNLVELTSVSGKTVGILCKLY